MAKSRPSVQKRAKETARLEKRRSKAAKQEQRKAEKEESDEPVVDGDPDLAGIVPGPNQPPPPGFED